MSTQELASINTRDELHAEAAEVRWPGQFVDPVLEDQFRRAALQRDFTLACRAAWFCWPTIVLFGFSDYTLFGFSAMFFGLAGLRLAVVAGTAGALFFLRHVRNPPVFDVVLTVWGLAVGAFVLFVNWTRPASFHGQIALDVLCVVLAYVALPLPLPRQMLLAGLFTVGNLLLFFLVKAPQGSMTVTVVVAAQVLANAAGILVSCSVKTRKRQLFAAYLREQQLRANLVKALAEVRTLRGLLPICATCKRVRDEEGGWQCVEIYVRDRTHADFTHSICPVCMTEALQDLKR